MAIQMKKTYLSLWLLIFIFLLPTSLLAFDIGARGYYWFPSLDGNVKVDEAAVSGTKINFKKELGIDDEYYPSIEAFLGSCRHHLSLIYTYIDYSGEKTLTENIRFNGKTYSSGNLVTSSITYKMMDLSYQYDFLDLENLLAGFSSGVVFQIKYLDGTVDLKSSTGIIIDEKEDFTLPIPMIGFNLHMGILANILEARLRGTVIGYSGNRLYDLMIEISWTPLPFLDIHGGYKDIVVDIDEDNILFYCGMSGPYVGLTVSF